MGLRKLVAAFVEVHRCLQAAPVAQLVHEQRLRGNGQHDRPAVVSFMFGERPQSEARSPQDAGHHLGRGVRRVLALLAEAQQQAPDATALEVVVIAAVVGGDEELHARIGPNFAVVLRDAGHRAAFRDVEAQHQVVARVEHAERNLRCVRKLFRPVAAGYGLRLDAGESRFDGGLVRGDDARDFAYLRHALRYLSTVSRTMRHISP